jgi:hypothetical protein
VSQFVVSSPEHPLSTINAVLVETIDDFSILNLGAGSNDNIAQISLPTWQGLVAIADAAFERENPAQSYDCANLGGNVHDGIPNQCPR